MKWVKRAAFIVVALGILALVAYGFMPKPVDVETAKVTRGELLVTIDNESRTRVRDRYTIVAPIAANMSRTSLKPGDTVAAGQQLCSLMPLPPQPLDARAQAEAKARILAAEQRALAAEAAVTAATAERKFAIKEHERLEGLGKKQLVSEEVVQAADTRRAAAEASLQSAQFSKAAAGHDLEMARAALVFSNDGADLAALPLVSPVAGRVLRVYRESAGAVMPGEMLIEIGNPASLEVVADVLSRDAVRIKPGMRVRMERWGGEGSLKGRVRVIEPSGFTKLSALGVEEQRVNVVIDFDEPPQKWAALGDSYRVEARVILVERLQTLKVPAGALFNTEDGPALFQVRDGVAHELKVKVGVRNGLEAEVLSGLNEGDEVIIHPGDNVKDGVEITPLK
ncbi:MAG: HlyD family efflux transporter periplasmic adaptor subunit [Planctomycetes bacterium]|nr:HlyD family efflux transporter periplasmic adaptor subunit [Planctomycetota bacterium]